MCCSPMPQRGEDCNTPFETLANVNMEKNVISSLFYTFFSSTLGLNGKEALCFRVLMGMKPVASDWTMVNDRPHCDTLNLDEMNNCQQLKYVKFL